MSEDKHFRRTLVLGLVISALLIGVGFWQSITMGIVCLVGCGALLAIFCLYTHNQTREIRRLSDYLTTLVNGTAPLLVPANNQEGELSLLENNIYKTARKLQTQAELMQKDKTYLADALADVSHQLKTPITSMTVMTDLLLEEEQDTYFPKFNVDGLLRGDYQSRMNGYAIGRQNGWMSANDIRELENLDRIPAEEGGDLYLINGNMLPLKNAGAFANTPTDDGKEENPDEEVLEVEKSDDDQSGDAGADTREDTISKRHHRRGKLV